MSVLPPSWLPTVLYTKCWRNGAGLAGWLDWRVLYALFPINLDGATTAGRSSVNVRATTYIFLSPSLHAGAMRTVCFACEHARGAHRKTTVAVTVYCSRKRRRRRAVRTALAHAHAKHTLAHIRSGLCCCGVLCCAEPHAADIVFGCVFGGPHTCVPPAAAGNDDVVACCLVARSRLGHGNVHHGRWRNGHNELISRTRQRLRCHVRIW